MIFAHLLLGMILGLLYKNFFFFILGSIFPDLDHIYIIIKNKIYKPKKLIETLKHEHKFNLRYKTALFHSLLGLILFSAIISIFNKQGGTYFAIAYLLHLLLDWTDIDVKYFLYPLKIKFKGFLPIWSKTEKAVTIILLLTILLMLKMN